MDTVKVGGRGYYGKGRPKFSIEKKKEIVKEYLENEGVVLQHLAEKYGVSCTAIHNWVKIFEAEVK